MAGERSGALLRTRQLQNSRIHQILRGAFFLRAEQPNKLQL